MSGIDDLGDEMGKFLRGLEPVWQRCHECGAESARATCWDCERIASKVAVARERYERAKDSVFEGYRVPFTETALAERKVSAAMLERAKTCLALPNVVIHGKGTGQGKSSLGGAMLLEWAAQNDGVARWVSAYKLSGGAFELDPELVTADLVLIDDVGNERQLASNLLPELCEMRRGNGRALWVTTPLDALGLAAKYGENIARRISGGARVLNFDKVTP